MRHNLFELKDELCQIALDAGSAIMRIYQGSEFTTTQLASKSDDSPLTMADLAAHHLIVKRLAHLRPDIPVVSEEDASSFIQAASAECYWLVDPLDGTKEFLARNGEFTVNIALIKDAEPLWGVVYAPALGQMFWGGREFGSYRKIGDSVEVISVSAPVSLGQRYRVVASKSHLNEQTVSFIKNLGLSEIVQAGSSLKFCKVAEGSADVYPRLSPTSRWDTAAAQAVLEGAGGYVFDTAGIRLRYDNSDVLNPSFIAASVSVHELMNGAT